MRTLAAAILIVASAVSFPASAGAADLDLAKTRYEEAAYEDALSLRPELVMAREDLKVKQFGVVVAQNLLRPDLRAQANYAMVGLGNRLDGNGTITTAAGSIPSNSLRTLFSGDFANWTVGLTMNVPIGFRTEYARVRQARLELAKSYAILKDQEKKG